MSSSFPSLVLTEATEADLPDLAEMNREAYLPETIAMFFFQDWPNKPATLAFHLERVTEKLHSPTAEVMKATDNATGELVGFVCLETVVKVPEGSSNSGGVSGSMNPHSKPPQGIDLGFGVPLLRQLHRLEEKHTPSQYLLMTTLVVAPQHQKKGVGSWIMQYCLEKADKAGLPTYLMSFPTAHDFYLKFSFKDMESFDIDLNEYGTKFRGFGIYRHYAMLREARNEVTG